MRRRRIATIACGGVLAGIAALATACGAAPDPRDRRHLERVVDEVTEEIMREHGVPGMAVAVTIDGRRDVFAYGVASTASGRPVTEHTLFEIGSVTKTFTATLAGRALATGALSLDDRASRIVPELAGSAFDAVSLLDLGTYTAGGLPLQFPDGIDGDAQALAWFAHWRPDHAAGTHRLYSNPSLGLFGELAARSLGAPFEFLMERLLTDLGLHETFLSVPAERLPDYADGHARDGSITHLTPGPFAAQAYGLVTTAPDLLRFVECNLDSRDLGIALQRAIAATHVGYYRIGPMTQGLGWEAYDDPTDLDALLAGNSPSVIFEPNPAVRVAAPQPDSTHRLYNKTGSTNGFGAYVAFVPARHLGIVLLANKNYPIPARIRAAHRILTALME